VRLVPLATILIVLAGCVPSISNEETGEGWSEYVPKTAPGPFVPATHHEGGKVVMPVTFLDGSTAEVVYDPKLRLAELGIRAWGAGGFPDAPWRDFQATQRSLDPWVLGEVPHDTYPGVGGEPVAHWASRDGEPAAWLVFAFGAWRVLMRDDGDPERWAQALRGHETEDGFLVLEGANGFHMAAAGEHSGPELTIGDTGPEFLLLRPGQCDARTDEPTRSDGFGSFCLDAGGGDVSVHVYFDDPGAVDTIQDGLEIRNYTAARP
jgi:hypothetical protein